MGDDTRSAVINRLTSRAWRDDAFRALLFDDAQAALLQEFGEIPEGFDRARFRPTEVDRVTVRNTADGRSLLVRPKRSDRPLSVVPRQVFGVRELVIVFYTKRCQYQCTFCTLPSTSAFSDVSDQGIQGQLDYAFAVAGDELRRSEQVSLGNEGSILDERTFSRSRLRPWRIDSPLQDR